MLNDLYIAPDHRNSICYTLPLYRANFCWFKVNYKCCISYYIWKGTTQTKIVTKKYTWHEKVGVRENMNEKVERCQRKRPRDRRDDVCFVLEWNKPQFGDLSTVNVPRKLEI